MNIRQLDHGGSNSGGGGSGDGVNDDDDACGMGKSNNIFRNSQMNGFDLNC